MEDQKSAFQLFCEENYYSETKGSKTITKAKGERIIKVLTNDPAAADYSPKFRHWVKQRGFKLVSFGFWVCFVVCCLSVTMIWFVVIVVICGIIISVLV